MSVDLDEKGSLACRLPGLLSLESGIMTRLPRSAPSAKLCDSILLPSKAVNDTAAHINIAGFELIAEQAKAHQ